MDALEQVMAEQPVFRDAVFQTLLKSIDIIDTFPDIVAFTKEILINVRDRACVQVNDRVSLIYARE